MTPTQYSEWRKGIDLYPQNDFTLGFYALGMCGEAGEAAEKIKKMYRDERAFDPLALAKELGDVVWYIDALASRLGMGLQQVIDLNVEKLNDRHARGVGRGSGDNR